MISHLSPPAHSPRYLPLGLGLGRYSRQMSVIVIFGGHVSGEGANAQYALRIHVTYDFNSMRLCQFCELVLSGW